MNNAKSLSIIVPVLNERDILPELAALLEQWKKLSQVKVSQVKVPQVENSQVESFQIEMIIVDGGSTDGTAELAEKMGLTVWRSHKGRACQMNFGAAKARGDVLLFLHADTRLPALYDSTPCWQLISQGLADSGKAWGRFDVEITGHNIMLKVIARLMNWRSRLTGIATGDQAIFVKRELFSQVGGFPEQPLMEDIEISSRLLAFGDPLCLSLQVSTSGRRWEKYGIWKTIFLMWRLRFAYWMGTPAEKLAQLYK